MLKYIFRISTAENLFFLYKVARRAIILKSVFKAFKNAEYTSRVKTAYKKYNLSESESLTFTTSKSFHDLCSRVFLTSVYNNELFPPAVINFCKHYYNENCIISEREIKMALILHKQCAKFNIKFERHLKADSVGLTINNKNVIKFLTEEFNKHENFSFDEISYNFVEKELIVNTSLNNEYLKSEIKKLI